MWRKAMVYLGLGDDAEYDEYDDGYGDEPDRSASRDRTYQQPARPQQSSNVSSVSPVNPVSAYPDEPSGIGAVRPIGARSADGREVSPVGQTVSPSGLG